MDENSAKPDDLLMHQLWSSFLAGRAVEMINIFRGVPVSNRAEITMVSKGYVALKAHSYQAVCVSMEKRTFLRGGNITGILRGHPVSVDVASGDILLTRLSPVEESVGQRMGLRVQPKEPVRVEIRTARGSVSSTLADLSPRGLGLFTFGAYVNDRADLAPGDRVDMEVYIPMSDTPLHFTGEIVNIRRERNSLLHRIGLHVQPDESAVQDLGRYIECRRTEILQELEKTYQVMVSSHA